MSNELSKPSRGTFTKVQKSVVHSALEHGKLQPQAVEVEEAVLGALMLEAKALNEVIDLLKPEIFYKEQHQRIMAAIQELFNNNGAIDILTVTDQLKKKGELEMVGGAFYIAQLTNRVASAANIEYHSRILLQQYIKRELISISSEITRESFEDTSDVFELLDSAESKLFEIAENNIRRSYKTISELIAEAKEQIGKASRQKFSGVPSGFTEIDRLTAGWQKSDMIVLAARPSMGKTAFVLSLALNIAVQSKMPVAFFSLEMGAVQLATRLISSVTGIEGDRLRKGALQDYEWHELNQKLTGLSDAGLFIDDTAALNIFELRAKCRRLKAQHDIQMVIIDYLQLMTVGGMNAKGNREQEISTISRQIKGLAKELQLPIIVLSQLSRDVEKRPGKDKRPVLSDLRESGAIEQDADLVLFIYRPEYYGLTEDEEGNSTTDMAEIIIAKHRNGATGRVKLKFIKQFAKFDDYDSHSQHGFDDPAIPSHMVVASKMNTDEPSMDEPPF